MCQQKKSFSKNCCCFSISIHNISKKNTTFHPHFNHSKNRVIPHQQSKNPTRKVFQSKKRRMSIKKKNPVPRCMKNRWVQKVGFDWKTWTTSTYFENGSRTHLRRHWLIPRNVYTLSSARFSSALRHHYLLLLSNNNLHFPIFLFITLVIRATLPTIQGWWAKNFWTAGSVHFFSLITQTPKYILCMPKKSLITTIQLQTRLKQKWRKKGHE